MLSPEPRLRPGSEPDLHSQLDLPLRGADRPAGRVARRRDRPERRVPELAVWERELRVVQDVEGLDPELGLDLPDRRVLHEREVDVEDPRPAAVVAADVPEGGGAVRRALK